MITIGEGGHCNRGGGCHLNKVKGPVHVGDNDHYNRKNILIERNVFEGQAGVHLSYMGTSQ